MRRILDKLVRRHGGTYRVRYIGWPMLGDDICYCLIELWFRNRMRVFSVSNPTTSSCIPCFGLEMFIANFITFDCLLGGDVLPIARIWVADL